ncbi:MAG: hypothetical protein J0M18_13665 [Ignavibacteria bacterium]|nr:hypothetical protein [Ignavibacteria bacterium]
MAYFLIIITGLIAIAGLLWKTNKDNKKGHWNILTPFGYVLITLIVCGSFVSIILQINQDNEIEIEKKNAILKEKQDSLNFKTTLEKFGIQLEKTDTISKVLDKQKETIDNLRKENTELSIKLGKANENMYNTLTGGNSYCHVELELSEDIKGPFFYINLLNNGDYTVFDVYISIIDWKNAQYLQSIKPKNEAFYESVKGAYTKEVGTFMSKRFSRIDHQFPFPAGNEGVYQIEIQQRNQTIFQIVRFQKINGKWTYATKATLRNESKVIWQYIDPSYPNKNIDGKGWWVK